MKTTIELPGPLLEEAKALAKKQNTTLKALIERSLKRELSSYDPPKDAIYLISELGLPYIPSRGGTVSEEAISQIREEEGI